MPCAKQPLEKTIEKGIRTAIEQRGGKVYKLHGTCPRHNWLGLPVEPLHPKE